MSDTYIKRGTTPTLPITILMSFDNVEYIDFMFKKELNSEYPELYSASFKFPENEEIIENEDESFIVNLKLSEEATRTLIVGKVYIDTRITLKNGDIPPTEVVEVDIGETLFGKARQT